MRAFLACYGYGQGGVWLYVKGDTAETVRRVYPKLTVFESPPPFWTNSLESAARKADPETSPFWRDWLANLKEST